MAKTASMFRLARIYSKLLGRGSVQADETVAPEGPNWNPRTSDLLYVSRGGILRVYLGKSVEPHSD